MPQDKLEVSQFDLGQYQLNSTKNAGSKCLSVAVFESKTDKP